MSIISKIIGGGGGSGLSEAQVDARVELYQPATGTFTPTIQDQSNSDAEGQTYTAQVGTYRKVGDVCLFWLDITINSLGTLTTTDGASIAGLPFTAASELYAVTVGLGDSLGLPAANQSVSAFVVSGTTRVGLRKWSATTGSTLFRVDELTTGGRLIVSGAYIIAP